MNNIYDEIKRMKVNLESSVKNKKQDVNYNNFKKKYRLGLASDEQLKSSFKNTNKLTFDECMRVAQTSGALCDPQGDIKYCPYMAYEDKTQNCYIGGIQNDLQQFNNTSGIPVYPTPLAGVEDIKVREKRTIENIKARLEEKKTQILGELEKQIYDTKVYLKALEENKSFNDANEIIKKRQELEEKEKERQSFENTKKNLEMKYNLLNDKHKDISNIANEKISREKEKEKYIKENYEKLNNLDKLLYNLRSKIDKNNNLFNLNDDIVFYLKIFMIFLFVFLISLFIFFKARSSAIQTS